MPAWHAWLLAAGTSFAVLFASSIYHQVKRILFHSKEKKISDVFFY
jgi:hypothetical protein